LQVKNEQEIKLKGRMPITIRFWTLDP